jgi:glucan phosphoethanolaminetransferase (alkaline phosphatase superfamily)
MNSSKKILLLLSLWIGLILTWLASLIEVTTLVSYENWFTGGEMFAWITANSYEEGDIVSYCLRFVWPYWALCTLLFLALGILVWWLVAKISNKYSRLLAVGMVCLLLVPFVLPVRNSLAHEILCVVRQVNNIECHQNDNADFAYHAHRDSVDANEVYLLSLGESVRYKNLSINGKYDRETTSLLSRQTNLCLYSDYYANATLTQHALPMLLTDAQADDFEKHFGRKSIAAAFSETGFKTALVSHRAQLMNNGYHDYLAKDFDTVVFVAHDSLIAAEIGKIAKNNAKLFIVTHYLGNHMFYTNRPEDCLVWRPDYNADPKAKSDSLFLNAYDNSLLYTDRLLNKEIETLKQMHRLAAWLFVSDHGEYISPKVSGHGHTYHPTIDEYHVPLMVWYSDEYKRAYPNKVANMMKHKDEPVCADHVFWSVLDMAGIRIDSTLQQEGMSIFDDTLLPHQRTLLLPDGRSVLTLD